MMFVGKQAQLFGLYSVWVAMGVGIPVINLNPLWL